jgi:site-specific recombinase XerD
MATARKKPKTKAEPVKTDAVLAEYESWLARQPLADRSQDAYRAQVGSFIEWLSTSEHGGEALSDAAVRDWAVRDYKRFIKAKKWKPSTVNQALASIDNFYRSLGVARPDVAREELAQVAPKALDEDDQRAFLRAVEGSPVARDRAIALVFFYTGLRLSELAGLDEADLAVSARRGRLTVRSGKGDTYREVPLNSACRTALSEWDIDRSTMVETLDDNTGAWWLSRTGSRMTPRAIDLVIRKLADKAGLSLSAHVLRHTCVTNLVRSGADVVLVAEIAGHRRLDTTRRYSLPSEADRDAALEAVIVDI